MHLRTVDGRLTLGSVYRLFVVGWLLSSGLLFGVMLLIVVAITLARGETSVNGEMVSGTGPILRAMLPILLVAPVVVVLQTFILGGFVSFGLWLYRLRRPLLVVAGDHPPTA